MGIRVDGLVKRFGGPDTIAAVDGVTFGVAPGALCAVVGPSGCGKSTLLRLIAGLEHPDAGQVWLGDRLVAGPETFVPPEARGTGVVFQSYALWPHMTVLGNVAFPAEAQGASRGEAEAAARRHLETVALTSLSDRKPAEISGGQRQRVALARCLAGGATTILMDEPLANLDPHLRAAMERELLDFHRRAGATTLYITHDQREAMALADTMAVMSAGSVLQMGPPEEVHARPASAEVAKFVGRGALAPVNWSQGRARLSGVDLAMEASPGQADGPALALIRPSQVAVHPAGNAPFSAQISSVLYRGGQWEGMAEVAGVPEPLEIMSPHRLRDGDSVGLEITGGWVVPG